jgi:hypothetical protein
MSAPSLAKKLRAYTEHEDDERFELANYTQVQAEQLVELAFSSPLEAAKEALRFTFVIGGGKLVRHKFDDNLGKYLTAALRKVGYEEDKAASLGSSKAYKMQHDLGQNLIYLHVFPEIVVTSKSAGPAEDAEAEAAITFNMDAPPVRCIACEVFDFKKLADSKFPSWLQRRRVLQLLQDAIKQIDAMEAKMVARVALTPVEQAKYDMASRQNLEEKVTLLQGLMKEQVSGGLLTSSERDIVLSEMESRLKTLDEEAAHALAEGHEKAAGQLKQQHNNLTARRDGVKEAFRTTAAVTRPVRSIADIKQARLQIARLDKLEATLTQGLAPGQKPLSAAELLSRRTEVDTRPSIQDKLNVLQSDARFWFELEDEFESRVKEGIMALGGSLKGMMSGKR